MLTGSYYSFDCMNAFIANKLFPESEFATEQKAIEFAANYEAILYKHTYNDEGIKISTKTLYDPWER